LAVSLLSSMAFVYYAGMHEMVFVK